MVTKAEGSAIGAMSVSCGWPTASPRAPRRVLEEIADEPPPLHVGWHGDETNFAYEPDCRLVVE